MLQKHQNIEAFKIHY